MPSLSLVYYPHPVLRKRCRPIERFDASLAALAARMFDIMREERGIGLAAPQVGLSVQMFVCNATGEPEGDMICVNPVLLDPEGVAEGDEGCLSIPDVSVPMRRATRITLKAFDATGRSFQLTGEALLARVWQHEYDHLLGRLIVDSMNDAVRIENRRAIKQLEDDFAKQGKSSSVSGAHGRRG